MIIKVLHCVPLSVAVTRPQAYHNL